VQQAQTPQEVKILSGIISGAEPLEWVDAGNLPARRAKGGRGFLLGLSSAIGGILRGYVGGTASLFL
jgi:hypothetical protein